MLSCRTLGLTAGAAALAPHRNATAATRDLHFRLYEDQETLSTGPSLSGMVHMVVGTYLADQLVYLGTAGRPRPWLAEAWELSDDSRQIAFKLGYGVKFHDGTDLDAAPVKFHFDSILDPGRASALRPAIAALNGVDVVDPATVRFNFSCPFAPFMTMLVWSFYGINSPTAVQRLGCHYGTCPVGSCPYRFVSWAPCCEILLVQLFRHPGHRRALPKFDGLDEALAGIETTLDPARRQLVVSEAQKILLRNRAIVPLLTNHNVTVIQAGLQNYLPDALNLIRPGDLRMANW